jgi:hypothetical protein
MVLDLVGEAGGEAVEFLGDAADGGDHEVVGEHGGMATSRPMTVAMRAPATPGAMAVRLAELARATPAKVSMTPQTGPEQSDEGTAGHGGGETIMPFSRAMASAAAASSSTTLTASNDGC